MTNLSVEVVKRPERRGYQLFVTTEVAGELRAFIPRDGRLVLGERVVPGCEIPSALFLDDDVFEALRVAILGEALHRDDALADARGTRDRLLALVESAWERNV